MDNPPSARNAPNSESLIKGLRDMPTNLATWTDEVVEEECNEEEGEYYREIVNAFVHDKEKQKEWGDLYANVNCATCISRQLTCERRGETVGCVECISRGQKCPTSKRFEAQQAAAWLGISPELSWARYLKWGKARRGKLPHKSAKRPRPSQADSGTYHPTKKFKSQAEAILELTMPSRIRKLRHFTGEGKATARIPGTTPSPLTSATSRASASPDRESPSPSKPASASAAVKLNFSSDPAVPKLDASPQTRSKSEKTIPQSVSQATSPTIHPTSPTQEKSLGGEVERLRQSNMDLNNRLAAVKAEYERERKDHRQDMEIARTEEQDHVRREMAAAKKAYDREMNDLKKEISKLQGRLASGDNSREQTEAAFKEIEEERDHLKRELVGLQARLSSEDNSRGKRDPSYRELESAANDLATVVSTVEFTLASTLEENEDSANSVFSECQKSLRDAGVEFMRKKRKIKS